MVVGERGGPQVHLRVHECEQVVWLRVYGAVDLATAPLLRAVLFDLLDAAEQVQIDLAGVTLLDGHSVGMLVAAHGRAQQHQTMLRAHGATGRVLRALEITGVAKLLDPDPDQPETADQSAVNRTVECLLRARARQPLVDAQRSALRQLAIHDAHGLAIRLAHRYRGRGETFDDLTQVALLGLIKAIDGYDPQQTTGFASYAVPTITGELKRHFRDKGWHIRVPRRLQELGCDLVSARELLVQRLGRSPTISELATHLDISEDQVAEAIKSSEAYRPGSLSAPVGSDSDGDGILADQIGFPDPGFELVEFREALRPLLASLPIRQQNIITMRFYGNLTQSQIAAQIGLSQMHISRLLTDALNRLRYGLNAG